MARIVLAALAIFSLAGPAVAEAGSASNQASQCVRVVRHAGGDMLENGCAGCRLVSVQRTRPGAGKPTSQTLTVPKISRQPLPFRGPGHTRITAPGSRPSGSAPAPRHNRSRPLATAPDKNACASSRIRRAAPR